MRRKVQLVYYYHNLFKVCFYYVLLFTFPLNWGIFQPLLTQILTIGQIHSYSQLSWQLHKSFRYHFFFTVGKYRALLAEIRKTHSLQKVFTIILRRGNRNTRTIITVIFETLSKTRAIRWITVTDRTSHRNWQNPYET